MIVDGRLQARQALDLDRIGNLLGHDGGGRAGTRRVFE